jgi:type IV secretory pathway VirB4 component
VFANDDERGLHADYEDWLEDVRSKLRQAPHEPISCHRHNRTAHMYVIGLSGKGKSKLLEYCLYQDIAAVRGCGLI